MFKLSYKKYIQALESARSLEKTLTEENERLRESSRNLSQNWSGSQAEKSLGVQSTHLFRKEPMPRRLPISMEWSLSWRNTCPASNS